VENYHLFKQFVFVAYVIISPFYPESNQKWKYKWTVTDLLNSINRAGLTRTPGYTRGGIRCLGGVSIPCRPVTVAVRPISLSSKRSNSCSESVRKELPQWLWNMLDSILVNGIYIVLVNNIVKATMKFVNEIEETLVT
jgi:hypothetical protein